MRLNKGQLDLADVKIQLDSLALELLRGRFPNVDVESYFRAAENVVEERKRQDKNYRADMECDDPVGNMIVFSMDKVQGAYMLIRGELTEVSQDRLLKDYEIMIGDYLQSIGHLRVLECRCFCLSLSCIAVVCSIENCRLSTLC